VEVVKNGKVWFQKNYVPGGPVSDRSRGKLYIELGWGEKGVVHEWVYA